MTVYWVVLVIANFISRIFFFIPLIHTAKVVLMYALLSKKYDLINKYHEKMWKIEKAGQPCRYDMLKTIVKFGIQERFDKLKKLK